MRRALLTIIMLFVLIITSISISAQLADTPWPTYRGNMKRNCLSPYTTDIESPHLKWKFNCENGVESSPAIGEDGTITITSYLFDKPDSRSKSINQWINIEVEDDGMGISEELKNSLFTLGISTKSGGSGFGLYISKYILEKSFGGSLDFESKPEKGTTFFISFPLKK